MTKDKIEVYVDLSANKAYVIITEPELEDIDAYVYLRTYSDYSSCD